MTFQFNAYSTPLVFGFVQGWLYAILFWIRAWRQERLSDWLLGWILVGSSFGIWEYMLGFGGVEILWQELEFFPRSLGLLFPPLCYFYLRSQLDVGFRWRGRDLLHALPFIIDTTYHLLVYSQGSRFVEHWEKVIHYPYHVGDVVFWLYNLSFLYYLYRSFQLYSAYRQWSTHQFSDIDRVSFRWFRNFMIALSVSQLVSLLMTSLDHWLVLSFWQDWWDKLVDVGLIYYVSIAGYAQAQLSDHLHFRPSLTPSLPLPVTSSTKSLTSPSADLREVLLAFMERERPYLEPDLTLISLARRLPTNSSILSQVINMELGKNFNDFINSYRIAEFNRALLDPQNAYLTQFGIAQNCGFNSKATFNRAYRKLMHQTPSHYAKQVMGDSWDRTID